jgi:hypothetical protein
MPGMPERDDLDRELDDMERRSERLGEDIEATRRDWEGKKADDSVPGAAGDPERAEEELPPEADAPGKRE